MNQRNHPVGAPSPTTYNSRTIAEPLTARTLIAKSLIAAATDRAPEDVYRYAANNNVPSGRIPPHGVGYYVQQSDLDSLRG
jgi:hypothetical protein